MLVAVTVVIDVAEADRPSYTRRRADRVAGLVSSYLGRIRHVRAVHEVTWTPTDRPGVADGS